MNKAAHCKEPCPLVREPIVKPIAHSSLRTYLSARIAFWHGLNPAAPLPIAAMEPATARPPAATPINGLADSDDDDDYDRPGYTVPLAPLPRAPIPFPSFLVGRGRNPYPVASREIPSFPGAGARGRASASRGRG